MSDYITRVTSCMYCDWVDVRNADEPFPKHECEAMRRVHGMDFGETLRRITAGYKAQSDARNAGSDILSQINFDEA